MAVFFAVFAACMLTALLCYGIYGKKLGYPAHIGLKMTCSSLFLIAGIGTVLWTWEGMPAGTRALALCVLLGLLLGWIGDLLLDVSAVRGEKWFIVGIFFFAANHAAYLTALFLHTPFRPADLLLFAALFLLTYAFGFGLLKWQVPKKLQFPGFFYFAVILLMVTKAFSFLFSGMGNAFDWMFAVGAVLFFTSDVVLVTNRFTQKERRALDYVNGFTYFYGQLIIACSLFFLS